MLLGNLAQSQELSPLLVRLHDVQERFKDKGEDLDSVKADLADALVDLVGRGQVSTKQHELIADILLDLVRQATKDLCMAVAERLAVMKDAPLRVILHLSTQEIEIARPVLMHSHVLTDYDLLCLIQAHGPAYWQAVATRPALGGDVIEALAERRDAGTARILVDNADVKITENAFHIFADMAQSDVALQKPLAQRTDIPAGVVKKIYDMAADAIRDEIAQRFGDNAEVMAVIRGQVQEIRQASEGSFRPTMDMLAFASTAHSKGILTTPFMVGTLKRGQVASFIAQLKVVASLPLETVEKILLQPCGQGLAIVCKALDIARNDFVQIYMLTQRYREANGIVDQRSMSQAIVYFDRMTPVLAQRILKNSQR